MTIPQLSPTHTKAKILKFCIPHPHEATYLECYDPIFVLRCSPDLVTQGYRQHDDHCPLMIVEAHDEGIFKISSDIALDQWYDVGHVIGEIDDEDDKDNDTGEWLWQAHSHTQDDKQLP